MIWMLSFWVTAGLPALCRGQNTLYEGNNLSESGYHVCIHNETRTVSSLVMHEVPYNVTKPCGGWLLWKTCTVTLHRRTSHTEYRTVVEHISRCCGGYEPVGRYCALPVNRSAKPGSCPTADGLDPKSEGCEWDMECPGWQKCCQGLGQSFCSDPTGSADSSENIKYRLNVTVTVEADYQQLKSEDEGLLNHTRLLQAMVTGALQSEHVSVFPFSSWAAQPHTTATSMLVELGVALPPSNVTSRMRLLLRRIPEASAVAVEDVDECTEPALRQCPPLADCYNTVGSHGCTCPQGYTDVDPRKPGVHCAGHRRDIELPSEVVPAGTDPTTTGAADRDAGSPTGSTHAAAAAPTPSTAVMTELSPPDTSPAVPGAVSVRCGAAVVTVTVERGFLLSSNIGDGALYLGLLECGVTGGNATHAELTVAWDECGTTLVHNDTYYTASVTLFSATDSYMSPSAALETPRTRLEVPVTCTYNKSTLVSSDSGSMGYYTIKEVVLGSDLLRPTMELSHGAAGSSSNYSFSPGEEVAIEVGVNTSSEQITVILNKCWVTPTPNPADTYSYTFLNNSCPLNTCTKVLVNGKSSKSRVLVQIFSLVKLEVVYLHCQVQICVRTGSNTCAISCVHRTGQSPHTVGAAFRSAGPLQRSEQNPPEQEYDTVHVIGLSCLGVGLSLFFIVGFVCLFYCQRNRIGHYNFSVRHKEENFATIVSA